MVTPPTQARKIFDGLESKIREASPGDFVVIPTERGVPYTVDKTIGESYELPIPIFRIVVSNQCPSFGGHTQYWLRVFEGSVCAVEFVEDLRDRDELRVYPIQELYLFIRTKLREMESQIELARQQEAEAKVERDKQDRLQRLEHVLES